jgi:hypothetical protein
MRRLLSLIVLYASIKHAAWAALLLFWADAGDATPLHAVLMIPLPRMLLVLFMLGASALALRVVYREPVSSQRAALLLAPQVLIVALAAFGSGEAIWSGHYADGVIRPRAFIAADQLHPLLLLLFHQVAFGSYFEPLWLRVRTIQWRV